MLNDIRACMRESMHWGEQYNPNAKGYACEHAYERKRRRRRSKTLKNNDEILVFMETFCFDYSLKLQ